MPRVYVRRDPVVRFWVRVNKNGPVHPKLGTRCWLWSKLPADSHYYGKIILPIHGGRFQETAHRFSWILHNGAIPDGLFVLHHCDVRPCVNPTHLFLGTGGDNIRDCAAKGRIYGQSKTHCPKGHEYAPDNLVSSRWRNCKTCHREGELARVYAKPGEMKRKAEMAREWRRKNPEKARIADARGVARRRERNLAKKSLAHPAP